MAHGFVPAEGILTLGSLLLFHPLHYFPLVVLVVIDSMPDVTPKTVGAPPRVTVGKLGPAWPDRQRGHLKPSGYAGELSPTNKVKLRF